MNSQNVGKKPSCWLGLHKSEIHKEMDLKDIKDNVVGLVIINRCTNCGNISHSKIRTVDPNYN